MVLFRLLSVALLVRLLLVTSDSPEKKAKNNAFSAG